MVGACPAYHARMRGNRLIRWERAPRRAVLILIAAVVLGWALSLQYLVQPFVWRNWTVGEVLWGWLFVVRDREVVALSIGCCVALAEQADTALASLHAALLAVSIATGALGGELLDRMLYSTSLTSDLAERALHWCGVGAAVALAFILWRRSIDSQERLRNEALQHANIEQQLAHTRLAALTSQVEPHFLFNTLATLRRLRDTEPAAGSRLLVCFREYLRLMLSIVDRSEVLLEQELALVRTYLGIMEIRLSGRLRTRIDVPPQLLAARVPPLSVATLVENAIKHGLTPASAGGEIHVSAAENAGQLLLCVTDTGVGLEAGPVGGSGIGLSNVRARLRTLYGARGQLRVEGHSPSGVRAGVELPLHRG